MVKALDLPAGRATMTPAELIHAILLAPVDLLWNGGIGTYVKASTETNAEVGDRANDAIRVNGSQLRCRVVGEGGNLGATQLGRIEAALRWGAHQHRRARQLRRRRHQRPRGQHQDPARAAHPRGRHDPQAAQRAAGADDRRGQRAGAARQLRAERPDRQRPSPGRHHAPGAPAPHPPPRAARRPGPGPGVPAQRRRDRLAPEGRPGPAVAGVLGPHRLHQARPQASAAAHRVAGRPVVPRHPRGLLPARDPGGVPRHARPAPAQARDHHQRGRELDGQPGRDHLRVPGQRGDRGERRADRPGLRGMP